MKKTMVLVALAMLACGQSFAQELLSNAAFNALDAAGTQQFGQTPTGWTVKATRGADTAYQDLLASEGFADVDGGGSGIFFKAFTGNPPWDPAVGDVDGSIYQDVAGSAGTLYKLTGWWGAQNNWSGFVTPGANAIFALDFYNGATLLGSAELDLEAAGLGDPATEPGSLDYEQFSVSAVAPAGTTSVRARGTMLDGVFNVDPGQALVTDAWSLRAVPEPTTALLGGLALLGLVVRRRNG